MSQLDEPNTRTYLQMHMPCGTDDPRIRYEPDDLEYTKAVEDYTDNLMDECKSYGRACAINSDNDIYDGILLPLLMAEIASWSGNVDESHERMKRMHVLLAGELQKIAEREIK